MAHSLLAAAMENSYEPSKEDIKILREWIQQVPYIPKNFDDQFLTAFYRAAKGSLQKAKTRLDNFTSLGYRHPAMYKGLDPRRKILRDFLDVAYFFSVSPSKQEDPLVLISALKPVPGDPLKHNVLQVFRLQLLALLLAIREERFGSSKVVIIADCSGLGLSHMRDMSPGSLTAWSGVVTDSLPARLQGIHAVNVPTIIEWVFNIIKKVSKEKISERTFVHSKSEGLLKHMSRQLLPDEYGGTAGPCEQLSKEWTGSLEKHRDYIVGIEESMRSLDAERPKSSTEELVNATFKQLNVD